MSKRKALIGVLVVAIIAVAAWAFGFFQRTDPAVAHLQEIGNQMWDQNLPEAQRNELRTDFRQRLQTLTDDQRRAFFDANRDQWTGRMEQRMNEFFSLPKADQQKRLDEIIDRMVQSRNSRQPNTRDGNRGRNLSDAQREERSKKRLDRTTPKMRAQFAEFRKQLDTRALQRGINLGDQRGWGRGGIGGGQRGA